MKYELKRIEIWPVVKIVFILSLLIGFFVSLLYAAMFLLMGVFTEAMGTSGFSEFENLAPMGGGILAAFVVIFGTFGIAIMYTLMAVIFTVVYNLLASWIGGYRFDLYKVDDSEIFQRIGD